MISLVKWDIRSLRLFKLFTAEWEMYCDKKR